MGTRQKLRDDRSPESAATAFCFMFRFSRHEKVGGVSRRVFDRTAKGGVCFSSET